MSVLSYESIFSESALAEAKRVWERLNPEAVTEHAKRLWPGGVERIAQRMILNTKFRPETGCAEWDRCCFTSHGYAQFYIGKLPHVGHRISWMLFVGNPGSLCVLHKCDNRPCVNPYHLFLGTKAHNVWDMDRKGRRRVARGEDSGTAKLTAEEVITIRARYKAHSKQDGGLALARDYSMSYQQIEDIVHRRNWRWLPDTNTQPPGDGQPTKGQ